MTHSRTKFGLPVAIVLAVASAAAVAQQQEPTSNINAAIDSARSAPHG